MGASGDMLMSALYELLPDKDVFRSRMERLGLPGVMFEYSTSVKCGITGTHISVKVGGAEEKSEDTHSQADRQKSADARANNANGKAQPHNAEDEHHHQRADEHLHAEEARHNQRAVQRYGYKAITDLIRGLELPDNILEDALAVYKIIGEAEAAVHGVSLDKMHLHEIGALDAVADIVGCCLLINMLGATEITASPVHVGFGSIRCEHGVLPVPAPAAAEILKNIPIYGGRIEGELCTPTGAALLKRFVTRFGAMAPMTVVKIGYGMGAKDFEAANCLRAFLCEDEITDGGKRDDVFEISCNLDDMTPEAVGAVFGPLFENGALDVYITPIIMKKNRPAVILTCLCAEEKRDNLARLILMHTSTLGVRISSCRRDILSRDIGVVTTEYGDIRVKRAQGYGAIKYKPEYDDVLKAAKKHSVPFSEVYGAASRAAFNGNSQR